MIPNRILCGCVLAAALSACLAPAAPDVPEKDAPGEGGRPDRAAPEGAAPGTCWHRTETPAVIETRTLQTIAQPAQLDPDGQVVRPAVYRTETRQAIMRERRENWFETPCPDRMTPDLIATLQRALAARGLYDGPDHGRLDPATRTAIRRYQTPLGQDTEALTLSTARRLGLLETEPG